MKITSVTVGESVQIFTGIGMPEKWNKISAIGELEEGDTIEDCIDQLFKKINVAHDKYSQSAIPQQRQIGDIHF